MIARIRSYASLCEAQDELSRLGFENCIKDVEDVDGLIFCFVEDERELPRSSEFEKIARTHSCVVGKSRSRKFFRYLMIGSPSAYREMLDHHADNEVIAHINIALKNFKSSKVAPVPLMRHQLSFERTLVMGILNVTPDSFFDGGTYIDKEKAVRRVFEMVDEGADIIDIGGESTRPFSTPVPENIELQRVMPVLQEIVPCISIPVSIDTRKPRVAKKAIELGAEIINDVSGLRDPQMLEVISETGAPVIVMHMLGDPQTMQLNIHYEDVIGEIAYFLAKSMKEAEKRDVDTRKIIIDPGIGFGKETEHNLEILRRLKELRCLGRPILVGASRKTFIGKILDLPKEERLEGSLASAAISVMNGADILRVHDVKETVRVCRLVDAVFKSSCSK